MIWGSIPKSTVPRTLPECLDVSLDSDPACSPGVASSQGLNVSVSTLRYQCLRFSATEGMNIPVSDLRACCLGWSPRWAGA